MHLWLRRHLLQKAKHVDPSKTKVQAQRKKRRQQVADPVIQLASVDGGASMDVDSDIGVTADVNSAGVSTIFVAGQEFVVTADDDVQPSADVTATSSKPFSTDDITMGFAAPEVQVSADTLHHGSADQPSSKDDPVTGSAATSNVPSDDTLITIPDDGSLPKVFADSPIVSADLPTGSVSIDTAKGKEVMIEESLPSRVSTEPVIPTDSTPLVDEVSPYSTFQPSIPAEGTQSAFTHEVPKADSVPPEPSISAEQSIPPQETATTEDVAADEEAYFSAAEEANLTAHESENLDTTDASHPSTTEKDLYYPHPLIQDVLWTTLDKFVEPVLMSWPGKKLREKALRTAMEHIHYEDENTRYICIGPVNKVLNMLCCWVEDPNSKAFKLHLARIQDYLQLWDAAFTVQAIMSTNLIEEFGPTLKNGHMFIKKSQVLYNCYGNLDYWYRHISKGAWSFSTADHGWPISDCTTEGLKGINRRILSTIGSGLEVVEATSFVSPKWVPQCSNIFLTRDHGIHLGEFESSSNNKDDEFVKPYKLITDRLIGLGICKDDGVAATTTAKAIMFLGFYK
ncbi:cycloartenol synthase [Artemisia annua]|uniref:Cycloartenol synthase n=1 Tax=Artemisia annua TaxID=35608 RepID=A0A2U1MGX0_ARTAN|nr:cycloartenol synthase [Artemisia annua]